MEIMIQCVRHFNDKHNYYSLVESLEYRYAFILRFAYFLKGILWKQRRFKNIPDYLNVMPLKLFIIQRSNTFCPQSNKNSTNDGFIESQTLNTFREELGNFIAKLKNHFCSKIIYTKTIEIQINIILNKRILEDKGENILKICNFFIE